MNIKTIAGANNAISLLKKDAKVILGISFLVLAVTLFNYFFIEDTNLYLPVVLFSISSLLFLGIEFLMPFVSPAHLEKGIQKEIEKLEFFINTFRKNVPEIDDMNWAYGVVEKYIISKQNVMKREDISVYSRVLVTKEMVVHSSLTEAKKLLNCLWKSNIKGIPFEKEERFLFQNYFYDTDHLSRSVFIKYFFSIVERKDNIEKELAKLESQSL